MSPPSAAHTALYITGFVLSLLTWTIAAGLVGKYYDDAAYRGNLNAANAVLAWGILSWLYYTAALAILWFISASSILVSVIVDVSVTGALFIFGIVATGVLSDYGGWFRGLHGLFHTNAGSIGQAVLAFGWMLVFVQLGTLLFEVIYTLVHYGGDTDTWSQSFHELTGGDGGFSGRSSGLGEKRFRFGRNGGGGGGGNGATVPAVQTA